MRELIGRTLMPEAESLSLADLSVSLFDPPARLLTPSDFLCSFCSFVLLTSLLKKGLMAADLISLFEF